MAEKRKISLVLADVDGTLVTEEKVLTKRAQDAVSALHNVGIRFAITSGRPPRGMAMLFDALKLDTPIAGFNGGLFVERDLTILQEKTVPPDIARQAIDVMREHGLDTWVYSGNDWLITRLAFCLTSWQERSTAVSTALTLIQKDTMRAPPSERCGALHHAYLAAEATLKFANNNRESCNFSVPLLSQVEGYHREAVQARDNACAGRPLRPYPADIIQREFIGSMVQFANCGN